MTFVIFFTCSLLSLNDMSKHSLVLWPLLLLLLSVFWGFFFGGGGGVVMFFLKKVLFCLFVCFVFFFSFFDGKSVMSALCIYYHMCMFV